MFFYAPARSIIQSKWLFDIAPAYASVNLNGRMRTEKRSRGKQAQLSSYPHKNYHSFSSTSNWPWICQKSPLLILTQKSYLGMRTPAYWRSTHHQHQLRWHKLRNILKVIMMILAGVSIVYSLLDVTFGRHFRHLIRDLKNQAKQPKSLLAVERAIRVVISLSEDPLITEKQQRMLDEHRIYIHRLVRDLEDQGIYWEQGTQLVQDDHGFWHNNRIRTQMFLYEFRYGWSSEDPSLDVGHSIDDDRSNDQTTWSPGSPSLQTSFKVAGVNESRDRTDQAVSKAQLIERELTDR